MMSGARKRRKPRKEVREAIMQAGSFMGRKVMRYEISKAMSQKGFRLLVRGTGKIYVFIPRSISIHRDDMT